MMHANSSINTVSVDAMSGDHGAPVTVPAAAAVLKQYQDLRIILVGDQDAIEAELGRFRGYDSNRLYIHHTTQVVAMDELPTTALRKRKESSMRVAINLLKQGKVQACVSAGNTGALMSMARFVLKTLPGIDRPAICAKIPSTNGHTYMLDLGANVSCSAEHLCQFAYMGSVLAQAIDGNQSPRIGLLNVGSEAIKGNEQVRQAAQLLCKEQLNYIGFIEGDDIFHGDADVVVCDGFVGNVALKSSEGVAQMITSHVKTAFNRNLLTRLAALIALPVLKQFRHRFDHRRYNGASFLGLQGAVIKSHGDADQFAFEHAIRVAWMEAKEEIPKRIDAQLSNMLAS